VVVDISNPLDVRTWDRLVTPLAEAGGLRPIDVGLHRARQLEQLGLLHIVLQEPLGAGFQSAVKLHW
jgi:8-hydroxy-5-deazaflavin:NADPH oxidoreductase